MVTSMVRVKPCDTCRGTIRPYVTSICLAVLPNCRRQKILMSSRLNNRSRDNRADLYAVILSEALKRLRPPMVVEISIQLVLYKLFVLYDCSVVPAFISFPCSPAVLQ